MFLVFVVASSYWRNAPIVGIKRVIVAAVVALLAVSASVITGSRTTWSVLVVFCAISFIGRGFNIGIIALGLILAFSFVVFVPDSFKGRLIQTFENRVSNRLENAESESAVDKFQTMDAGRYKNWVGTYRTLVYVPWVIPFGGGFNSFRYVISPYGLISDTSAHNIYLTLICEVGVVGLFLYLLWFKRIWQETTALNATCAKLKGRAKVFLPFEIKPLLIAMLVSLSAGEILYPVRPAFAFMGMFLFVCAILNHKAFVTGIEASELNKQLIVQRLVTRLVYVRKLHKIRASLSASNS
jgi:O-antigen ligase